MNAVHVIVHTPEQAREILETAWTITQELEPGEDRWEAVFREAVRLLGARATFIQQAAPTDLHTAAILNDLRSK